MSRPEHVIVDELDPKEKGLTIGDYLKDNYKNKSIGKEAVPFIKPIVDSVGSAYTDTMRDARRGLLGPHSFVGAHAINLAGKVIPDIPIDKSIKHALHEWGGVDEYLSGVAGQGAEIALTRKGLKIASKVKPKHLGITQTTEPYTKGLNPKSTKVMKNITKDVTEILETAPASYLRKVSEIYKHHEGGITWKQAMMMAKLPKKSSSIHLYKDSEIEVKKGGLLDPDRQEPTEMYSTGVDPEINWNRYGYTPGTEPTQVRNVKNDPQKKIEVANSLNAFYQKTQEIVQSRTGSRASSRQIKQALKNQPQYWTNPNTQKIYRAAWKGGLSNRYTLKPINRQYLEKQQSTAIQKQIQTQYQKGIQKKNIDLKQAHDDKYKILSEELSSVQTTIADYNKRGIRGPDYDTAITKQNDLNTQINNLEEGRWYTEHNVYLQSEKARNYILDNSGVRINDSKEFQLGNVANQTPRLENLKNPDTTVFRTLKNNLERVLDDSPDGYFSYPNYIVNSNPRLSGGREGIIRIEYSPMEWQPVPGTDRMRPVLKDFKVKGGILSGKSVVEIDTKDLDFIKRELNTPEDIQNWLSREHGINPVSQDQSFPKESFEIRLSKSPLISRAEQIKQFQKLVEDVQAGRKTWAEVFAEEGIEIVPQTGKGKTILTAEQKATKLRKQAIRAAKKKARRVQIETTAQEQQGQIDATEKLTGPKDMQNFLDKELPDR